MGELREHYNGLVEDAKTLMGVRYFLAYEEILERYKGSENIIKWIDILCDRGVLVTRNYCENGIFYRACRSGETDFDLLEKKSGAIVLTAANACGESYELKDGKWFSDISTTYLNKVLANFVYDYPCEDYDCHTISSRPYNYGPLVYIQDKIDGNAALPLYSINKISQYCTYDRAKEKFVAFSNKNKEVKEELSNRIGQHDDIPYTELTAYFGFLKYVREQNGTDNFLNALSICRDEATYLRHIYHNLLGAYRDISSARRNVIEKNAERQLRQAAALVGSAHTKLKFEQSRIKEFIEELKPEMVYEQAQQKILESFIPFDESFSKDILPILKQTADLEFLLVNAMLFDSVHETKYWNKMYNQYLQQNIIIDNNFVLINNMIATYSSWDDGQYTQYENLYNQIFEKCIRLIEEKLSYICGRVNEEKNRIKKKREKEKVVNNIEHHIWKQEYKNVLILFYTFSGYQNINDEKDVDIVKLVQSVATKKFEGGTLICGAEEKRFGVYVTDSLENALVFANELLQVSKRYNNVFF